MKERPILFSVEMVRAILDGRKTQTRRPVKPQPGDVAWGPGGEPWDPSNGCTLQPAPLGTVGDLLWVRETTCIAPRRFAEPDETCVTDSGGFKRYVSYKADGHSEDAMRDYNLKWTPSIHVPRWASRIDLEITSVRVERVQDITEEDAMREAPDSFLHTPGLCTEDPRMYLLNDGAWKAAFRDLWQSIYGNWDANPWVWVYKFRRTK